MKVLVTGDSGLIGSEAVESFAADGHEVHGLDNNMRKVFFGPSADTRWRLNLLLETVSGFQHHHVDIRDRHALTDLFATHRFDCVIHCAAQPSHDRAREIPILDFEVNAMGTLNLLEATRQHAPDAVFIHMSTNKVYGDAPNEKPLVELETRWDYRDPADYEGIDETCRVDQSLHSVFGASKAAADIMAQEYGRNYGLRVGIFRGGCLTGPSHSGVELHGFLAYLVQVALTGKRYTIFGYQGKQVRDQIHSRDVIAAMKAFIGNPRYGEVYNLGGGRANSASVLECIDKVEQATGRKVDWEYRDSHRTGDHICYISNLGKFRHHYPEWTLEFRLDEIIETMARAGSDRLTREAKSSARVS